MGWVVPKRGRVWCRKDTVRPCSDIRFWELAWVAGFLEGEGYFGGANGRTEITAPQVQREPLLRLQSYLGGRLRFRKSQQLWIWGLHGLMAVQAMMSLLPLMSPRRREQINRVLGQTSRGFQAAPETVKGVSK